MNETLIFDFEQNRVRTVLVNNEPFFVGKDVATILKYKDTSDALKRHVDEEDKLTRHFTDSGQNRSMYIINESGLYSLILSSKLPNAKRFKRWVTSEVLPQIRKTGSYGVQAPRTMKEALQLALEQQEKLESLQLENIELKPKALFADSVSSSDTSILVGDLAKILKQNGIEIGARRLFGWLRDKGYLIKRSGTDYNMPTQKSMELGLFQIKETVIARSNGRNTISKTPKITGKGQIYFINKFQKELLITTL